MSSRLSLEKFTIGVGDRFAHQAKAQLKAFELAAAQGIAVTPVWNKSNREHTFIGSHPQSVFDAAQAAVKASGWAGGWHVDADHIRLETVDKFLRCSDFFTIDVADNIGKPPEERFDLNVNNAPAAQVFMAIVSGTRYSMLVHPDIKETISVNLKSVTINEALEAVRELYGYEYKVQGTRIYVQPVTIQTRLFQVNYLAGRRVGRACLRSRSAEDADQRGRGQDRHDARLGAALSADAEGSWIYRFGGRSVLSDAAHPRTWLQLCVVGAA